MSEALRLTAVAFQFMTRLPVPQIEVRAGDLNRAAPMFPVVGLAVAAAGIVVRIALEPWWGSAVATIGAIVTMIAATGAFHEDALADSFDGMWGGWTVERRLEIMRDSRLGSYGTIALVSSFALRIGLLAPLGAGGFARACVVGHVLGRTGSLALAGSLPAASPGLAADVGRPATRGSVLAAAFAIACTALACGIYAPVPIAAGALVWEVWRRIVRARIGGVTGDLLGAVNVLVELASMAAVVALIGGGLL